MYTPKCPMCDSENIITDEQLDLIVLDTEHSRTIERDLGGHCADCNTPFRWVEYYVLDQVADVYCEKLGELQRAEAEQNTVIVTNS